MSANLYCVTKHSKFEGRPCISENTKFPVVLLWKYIKCLPLQKVITILWVNITRGTTDPEIASITYLINCKFDLKVAPLALIANLVTRWRIFFIKSAKVFSSNGHLDNRSEPRYIHSRKKAGSRDPGSRTFFGPN